LESHTDPPQRVEAGTVNTLEQAIDGQRRDLVDGDRLFAKRNVPWSRHGRHCIEQRRDDSPLGEAAESPVGDGENEPP